MESEKRTGRFSLRAWRGGGCLALAIDPRFSRCKPGCFGAFLIVKPAARIGRTNRRRLFAEKGDAELAYPLARPFQLHRERDGVQFIPVFLMPAAVTVEDAVAGFRIDGSPEQGVLVTPSIAPPQSGTGHGLLNFSTAPA